MIRSDEHHPRPSDMDADEGFLQRWSRRKQGVQDEEQPPAPESPEPAPVPEAEAPVLGDADMPSLETIEESRDVSPFFSEGVSEHLRRQALRRLFSLPGFNLRDGLDDYDEDYRSFAALVDIITSDMKFDQERLERLAAERRAAADAEAAPEPAADSESDLARNAPAEPGAGSHGSYPTDDGDAEEKI